MPAPKRRRRRTASIATLIGGAIAAFLVQCVSQNTEQKSTPETAQNPKAPTEDRSENQSSVPINGKSSGRVDKFYQLVLTITPAFCELNPEKSLCFESQTTPPLLTLHGLWPERLNSKMAPSHCKGPALDLNAQFDPRLARWMPGSISGLPQYEWKKHGSCSGLKPMRYFSEAIDWAERINRAISPLLNRGNAYSSAGFKAAASKNFPASETAPALGEAISLHCKRIKTPTGDNSEARQSAPHLLEIRVCLNSANDFAPAQLLECAALDRIDQGCGKRFWIDS